jgi:hypothetical protein
MPLHYDLLEPGLGISARPASGDDVRDSPFGGILNLCDFRPPRYAGTLPSGIELVLRPINDEIPVPLPTLKLAVLELAEMRSRGVATLVHCQAGQSRSPTVVALYWMARDGVTWSDALNRLREIRPMIEPNRFFQTEPRRNTIVDAVRDFMAGDQALLEQARQRHAALIETLKQPQHDLVLGMPGGFPGGIPGVSRLAERIFATPGPLMLDALTVPAVGLFVCAGTDTMERGLPGVEQSSRVRHWEPAWVEDTACVEGRARFKAVLTAMRSSHDAGLGVCVIAPEDLFSGAVVLCAHLLLAHRLDLASALLLVGSRRPPMWRDLDRLWSFNWSELMTDPGPDQ